VLAPLVKGLAHDAAPGCRIFPIPAVAIYIKAALPKSLLANFLTLLTKLLTPFLAPLKTLLTKLPKP